MTTFAEIPFFGQFVEYIIQGELANDNYGIEIHPADITQSDLTNPLTVAALNSDYQKPDVSNRVQNLRVDEVGAIKSDLNLYHSDVVALVTHSSKPNEIVSELVFVQSRPEWKTGIAVKPGDVYSFQSNLYQVVQAHTTQSDWTPIVAKALWKRYYEPTDDPWDWVQPLGSFDAYPIGARVKYGGYVWENTIAANVLAAWCNWMDEPHPTTNKRLVDWCSLQGGRLSDV